LLKLGDTTHHGLPGSAGRLAAKRKRNPAPSG
jgi:hypothetical protein